MATRNPTRYPTNSQLTITRLFSVPNSAWDREHNSLAASLCPSCLRVLHPLRSCPKRTRRVHFNSASGKKLRRVSAAELEASTRVAVRYYCLSCHIVYKVCTSSLPRPPWLALIPPCGPIAGGWQHEPDAPARVTAATTSAAPAHWQFDFCCRPEGGALVRALAKVWGGRFFHHLAKNLSPAAAGS
jgi:hypothetical protein